MLKQLSLITIFFFIFSGCYFFEEDEKIGPNFSHSYSIVKNTNHNILLELYYDDTIRRDFFLSQLDTLRYTGQYASDQYINFWFVRIERDSIIVTFDDSVSITHYPNTCSGAERSFLFEENWSLKYGTDHKAYEYIFTDNDYIEALGE